MLPQAQKKQLFAESASVFLLDGVGSGVTIY